MGQLGDLSPQGSVVVSYHFMFHSEYTELRDLSGRHLRWPCFHQHTEHWLDLATKVPYSGG